MDWKKRWRKFFSTMRKQTIIFSISALSGYIVGILIESIMPSTSFIPVIALLAVSILSFIVFNTTSLFHVLFPKYPDYDDSSKNLKEVKYESKKKTVARWEKIRFQMLCQVTYSGFEEEGKKLIYLLDALAENPTFTKEESVQIFRDIPQECVAILQTFKKLNEQQRPEMRKQINELLQQTHKHLTHQYLEPLHQQWEDTCKEKIQNMKQKFGENIYLDDEY